MPRLISHPEQVSMGITEFDVTQPVEFLEFEGGLELFGKIPGPPAIAADIKIADAVKGISRGSDGPRGE
jgi:hypothetical protein